MLGELQEESKINFCSCEEDMVFQETGLEGDKNTCCMRTTGLER